MKKLVLIGGGGHCRSVIDVLADLPEFEIVGIIDPALKKNSRVCGITVLGGDRVLTKLRREGVRNALITVGSVALGTVRKKLYEKARNSGFALPVVVSRHAVVSKRAKIGGGSFVGHGAVINTGAVIGENCIINTGAVIDHDCRIGNHVHVAPGVALSGAVIVGHLSLVGTGSSVIQQIVIGERTIVGAGSVVTRDIRSGIVACGSPCAPVRKTNG